MASDDELALKLTTLQNCPTLHTWENQTAPSLRACPNCYGTTGFITLVGKESEADVGFLRCPYVECPRCKGHFCMHCNQSATCGNAPVIGKICGPHRRAPCGNMLAPRGFNLFT
eukprot:m.43187 g.43187  ORF g.43187 m.43187 type:complete len:114 (+) comp12188_c0_seq2:109-450(+)